MLIHSVNFNNDYLSLGFDLDCECGQEVNLTIRRDFGTGDASCDVYHRKRSRSYQTMPSKKHLAGAIDYVTGTAKCSVIIGGLQVESREEGINRWLDNYEATYATKGDTPC